MGDSSIGKCQGFTLTGGQICQDSVNENPDSTHPTAHGSMVAYRRISIYA